MPSRLVYNGTLSTKTLEIIERELNEYPYPVEVTRCRFAILDELFKDRSWTHHGEDCMGRATSEIRQGIPYCYVVRDFGNRDDPSGFLMFPDREAASRFVAHHPELVIDASPFKMTLRSPDGIHEARLTAGRPVSTYEAVFGPNPPPLGRLLVYLIVVLALIAALSGCATTGSDYRRPISQGGTMIGPYDVTLTSHQEALGIRR